MKYQCRPGVVFCKICGESLLIPVRNSLEAEHEVVHLTLAASIVWRAIESGKSFDKIYKIFEILTHDKNQGVETVNKIINEFKVKDLIIESEV